MNTLCLDIGGTFVKYALFRENDKILGEFSVCDENGNEKLPERIVEFLGRYSADRLGICAPGPFDFTSGTGLMTHKLKSLYHVSLRERIKDRFPDTEVMFIHDSTAFLFGVLEEKPLLKNGNFSCVMLGTGLGYVNCVDGYMQANETETPYRPLWNKKYKDGIAEDYVSTRAIFSQIKSAGYDIGSIKQAAEIARNGNTDLLRIFQSTGTDLGLMLDEKRIEDGFDTVAFGGQISLSWDLFKKGFESVNNIKYYVTGNPAERPLIGIKNCMDTGKKDLYRIMGD